MNKLQMAKDMAKNLTKDQKEALELLFKIYVDYCNNENIEPSRKGFIKFCKEVQKKAKEKGDE